MLKQFQVFSVSAFQTFNSWQLVGLRQGDAGGPILAAHDRGVVARNQRHENGGLAIIRRREPGVLDIGSVRRIAPVVVGTQKSPVAAVKLEGRILQRAWYRVAVDFDRRTQGPEQDPLRNSAL